MDPIIACSSGSSTNSAIAVIRISGFEDISFFKNDLEIDFQKIIPRNMHFTKILDGEGKTIDEITICFFPNPKSYTGENVLELFVHGNLLNIERITDLFLAEKRCRLANPGEFSLRALKNKKLTLSQVEGLDVLLNANSPYALNHGLDLLNGELCQKYLGLSENFVQMRSAVELLTDFSDDVGEEEVLKLLRTSTDILTNSVEGLAERVKGYNPSILNPKIALIGQPNAGKSTFFNNFVGHERAIVTPIKGTTRDYLQESVKIGENFFEIVDTAGIRKTEDLVEKEGIKRTFQKHSESFFSIALVDPSNFEQKDYEEIEGVDLLVFTHCDNGEIPELPKIPFKYQYKAFAGMGFFSGPIGPEEKSGPIGPEEKSGPIGPEEKSGPIGPDGKSGPIGPDSGGKVSYPVEKIKKLIVEKYNSLINANPILIKRHQSLIKELNDAVHAFSKAVEGSIDVGVLASEINILDSYISDLIGVTYPDDILNNVFDNICIGK